MAPNNRTLPKRWAAQNDFITFLGPFYAKALREGRITRFFDLVFILWFDRFPIEASTLDSGDSDAEANEIARVAWATKVEKREIRHRMFVGSLSSKNPAGDDWETQLSLEVDRERRRLTYLELATTWAIYLEGYQYDSVLSLEERRRKTREELEEEFLERINAPGGLYEF